jgi:group I intron endonuclease
LVLSEIIPISGVYKITNTVNNRIYIGQSNYLYMRWCEHVKDLSTGKHSNKELYSDFLKYGMENFTVEVILTCSKEDLLILEHEYIEKYYFEGFDLYNNIPKDILAKKAVLEVA